MKRDKMDWTNEIAMLFLEQYKRHSCVWDPKDINYKNRLRVAEAWNDMKDNIGVECTVEALKRKRESLMAAYRAYKNKIKKASASGEEYQPSWYAFEAMDSFLGSVYESSHFENEGPTSHAEKQRKYREKLKLNSEKYESVKQRHRDHMRSVRRPTAEVSEGERAKRRGQWRRANENRRRKRECLGEGSFEEGHLSEYSACRANDDLSEGIDYLDDSLFDEDPLIMEIPMHKENPSRKRDSGLRKEDDESDLFAKFLAKKLRRMPEERRDYMMYKINKMVYEESYGRPDCSAGDVSPVYLDESESPLKRE